MPIDSPESLREHLELALNLRGLHALHADALHALPMNKQLVPRRLERRSSGEAL